MSDMSGNRSAAAAGSGQGQGQAGSITEQAKNLASGVRDTASGMMDQATRTLKEQASGMADNAKNLASGFASEAGDRLRNAAEEQKAAGADYVRGVASALRRAAGEFEQIPQAPQYLRSAADQIESVSESLRRRDVTELVGGVQDFARRQPTAFLGIAALAGFALVRFFKSSTAAASSQPRMGASGYRPTEAYPAGGRETSTHLGAMTPGYTPELPRSTGGSGMQPGGMSSGRP